MAKRVLMGGNGTPSKKPRMPGAVSLEGHRFAIGSQVPGIVIGKGGARIKSIKEEAGVHISISDKHPQSQDFIMVIKGDPEHTAQAIFLISSAIIEANKSATEDRQAQHMVRLLLHVSLSGTVIGKGGATIKQIMVTPFP